MSYPDSSQTCLDTRIHVSRKGLGRSETADRFVRISDETGLLS